jgi:hypothetical protein
VAGSALARGAAAGGGGGELSEDEQLRRAIEESLSSSSRAGGDDVGAVVDWGVAPTAPAPSATPTFVGSSGRAAGGAEGSSSGSAAPKVQPAAPSAASGSGSSSRGSGSGGSSRGGGTAAQPTDAGDSYEFVYESDGDGDAAAAAAAAAAAGEHAAKRARLGLPAEGEAVSPPSRPRGVAPALPPSAPPPEPADGARVSIRLPNGSRVVRRVAPGEPVAALYHVVACLLGSPHSIATVYAHALRAAGVGGAVSPADVSASATALGAETAEGGAVEGGPGGGLRLQAAAPGKPESWVDRWDLRTAAPPASLAPTAGSSVAAAKLANAQVVVHMLA